MFILISRQIEFQNLDAIFISSGEQNTCLNIIYCLVFLKTLSTGEQNSVFTGLNSVKC